MGWSYCLDMTTLVLPLSEGIVCSCPLSLQVCGGLPDGLVHDLPEALRVADLRLRSGSIVSGE